MNPNYPHRRHTTHTEIIERETPPNFGIESHFAYMSGKGRSIRAKLARKWKVKKAALARLRIGWDKVGRHATVPLYTATRRVVTRMGYYMDGATSITTYGDTRGLFLPTDPDLCPGIRLSVCIGIENTSAALSIGENAVGLCTSFLGIGELGKLVRALEPKEIAVWSSAAQEDQKIVRAAIAATCLHVRRIAVVYAPAPHQDLSAWVASGATKRQFNARVSTTTSLKVSIEHGNH